MAKARRTTHRSSTGKKLAVRDKSKDIQTYERAHRADLAHRKAERKITHASYAQALISQGFLSCDSSEARSD
jgi:hypothetical protein